MGCPKSRGLCETWESSVATIDTVYVKPGGLEHIGVYSERFKDCRYEH